MPLAQRPAPGRRLARCILIVAIAIPAMGATAQPVAVAIEKFAFVPREVTIAPGTTVAWTNGDETPHTVTTRDGGFGSKAMDTNDRYEYTFTRAGDFAYFCTLHPFMTGVVHVREGAKTQEPPP